MAALRRRSSQRSPHPITTTVRMPHGWTRQLCWRGLTRYQVLQPYAETAPEDIVPILILDSYRCHMMASVVQKIQGELGVEVKHIPGGCTSLCQPVDVGFNKPFEDRLQRLWASWMISEGIVHGTTSPPTRLDKQWRT